MRLNELKDNQGATHRKKRIGRGIGSGKGKTGGRGVKGQKSRSGVTINGFEGGQMPIYMRLPKRGFNAPNRKTYQELSIATVNRAIKAGKIDAKTDYDAAALVAAGVIRRAKDGVRLIGSGKVDGAVKLHVSGATKNAVAAVEAAKGSVNVLNEETVYRAKGEKQDRSGKKTKATQKAYIISARSQHGSQLILRWLTKSSTHSPDVSNGMSGSSKLKSSLKAKIQVQVSRYPRGTFYFLQEIPN